MIDIGGVTKLELDNEEKRGETPLQPGSAWPELSSVLEEKPGLTTRRPIMINYREKTHATIIFVYAFILLDKKTLIH